MGDFIVEEGNLTQAVFLLRRTLGKLPGGGEFVETLPRQGYRLASKALAAAEIEAPERALDDDCSSFPPVARTEYVGLMVDAIEDCAIFMLDCAGRVLTWNLGAERINGYRSEEVLGQHDSLFFTAEDIADRTPERELARAMKSGHLSGEGWRSRRNGDRFWAGFSLTAVRGPDGRLIGFAKVVRDLSGRKRQEDALLRLQFLLRNDRERLRAAAESSLDALVICGAVRNPQGSIEDFTLTHLNANVARMASVPRHLLLGAKMREIRSAHPFMSLFEQYKQVVETGIPYVTEMQPVIAMERTYVRAVRLLDGVFISACNIMESEPLQQGSRRRKDLSRVGLAETEESGELASSLGPVAKVVCIGVGGPLSS